MADQAKIVVEKPVTVVTPLPAPMKAPAARSPEVFRFAKLMDVCEVLNFADGTNYKFRLIKSNSSGSYCSTSSLVTTDVKLAANLRSLLKTNKYLREITVQKS